MNRRNLLKTTAAGGLLAFIAGCKSNSSTPIGTQLNEALAVGQTIDASLIKITTDITNPPISLISTTVEQNVINDLNLAATGIAAFQGGTQPPAGASTLTQINDWFTIALNTAAPVLAVVDPAAGPIILALEAVDALLPVFEAQIQQASGATAAVVMGTGRMKIHASRMASGNATMTTDQALKVLGSYLNGK